MAPMSSFTTIKVWTETRRLIRIIAALVDQPMAQVIHNLAIVELARLKQENSKSEDK